MAQNKFSTKALDLIIYTVVGLVIFVVLYYLVIKKIITQIATAKKDNLLGEIGSNPTVDQAVRLRGGLNPSGNDWMIGFDGTDEDTIFKVALEITDFSAVVKTYGTLYGGANLTEDLRAELSTADFAKFTTLLQTKGNTGTTNTSVPEPVIVQSNFPAGQSFKAGATVKIKTGITSNVRSADNIYSKIGTAAAGQKMGTVVKTYNFKKGANTPATGFTYGEYVLLENVPNFGRCYVYKNNLTI